MSAPRMLTDPGLEASLSHWEKHGRPAVPIAGFSLSRLSGRERRGIYHAHDGAVVAEPQEHVLMMVPAPDRRHIALQLADRADENGVMAILEVSTGSIRRYPEIRCRYEPMRWTADSQRVELIAREPHSLVQLDLASGTITTENVRQDARVRLFAAGPNGLLTESQAGAPTRVLDRKTGAYLASFPAIRRILDFGAEVIVDTGRALHSFDPGTGAEKWSWDSSVKITSVAVAHDGVHIAVVRSGRSVVMTIAQGKVVSEFPVFYQGSPAVVSELSADSVVSSRDGSDGVDGATVRGLTGQDLTGRGLTGQGLNVYALVEAPLLPPRVVTFDELRETSIKGASASDDKNQPTTRWHRIRADDGASLAVAVTSATGVQGPKPMILTCYGGFDVADLPVFEPTIPAWIEYGGSYATAHIRGGGEYDASWRDAGRGRNKHRGIDDLACLAKGLIDAGLTRADLLILMGASHGGVLVTSCALGHPGLCAGVVSTAAPLDLLALENHPLGGIWNSEFGDNTTPEGRAEMQRISPLHRARNFPGNTALKAEVPPDFLGIVLEEDSRVSADPTKSIVEVLRAKGGCAVMWQAPKTGHGSNHLDSLHRLGATVLSFAAASAGKSARHSQLAKSAAPKNSASKTSQ